MDLNIIEFKELEGFIYHVDNNAKHGISTFGIYDSVEELHNSIRKEGGSWEIFTDQVKNDWYEVIRYDGKVVVYEIPIDLRKA